MERYSHYSILEICPAKSSDFSVQVSWHLDCFTGFTQCLYNDTVYFRYKTRDPLSLAREITSFEINLAFSDRGYFLPVTKSVAKIHDGLTEMCVAHNIYIDMLYVDPKRLCFKQLQKLSILQCASTLDF